jgi:hypothetical protein
MASHRAMKDLAENPEAVRALARGLLSLGAPVANPLVQPQMCAREPVAGGSARGQAVFVIEWTDWELDFLEGLLQRQSGEPLSMRQREKLVELKSAVERYTTFEGFSVRALIERAFMERVELDDDEDQHFIADLKASSTGSVSRWQMIRLLTCCRALGIVEAYQGLAG